MDLRTYFIFFIALFVCSESAYSGNRGYKVVFFDSNKVFQNKTLFKKYRNQYGFDTLGSCWKERNGNWIDIAYINKLPTGINEKLIYDVQHQLPGAIGKLKYILSNYKDDEIDNGFDGIYIAENKNNTLVIQGISSSGESVITNKQLPISLKQFDLLICKASKAFDKKFNP
ncbi:hypothetical protein [Sulfuriferula thiophila]|uniref:hypothetical protein n=1 Tax=Sulfuriferula thiophila TaxID=1781211 RepID=UPI000F615C7A|nr:hypothetical protein [Sulfuriferula thiophila]